MCPVWNLVYLGTAEVWGFVGLTEALGFPPTHPTDLPVLGTLFRQLTLVCCCSV